MEYETILYEMEDHVVTITLNRPEVHNCINRAMALELQTAWKVFRDDDDAFVAILTGAGEKAFSAGWDLNDAAAMQTLGNWDEYRQWVYNEEGPCGYTRRVDIFKPIIAAVNAGIDMFDCILPTRNGRNAFAFTKNQPNTEK